jgi:hypothetical protein
MRNTKENVLNDFLEEDEIIKENKKVKSTKKNVVMTEREGLIERVDRQFVTNDGRQLLREQY